jgi:hypothetical protein
MIESEAATSVSKELITGLDLSPSGKIVPMIDRSRSTKLLLPPRWLCQLLQWFRFGLALFVLISVLLGTTGCTQSNAATVPWEAATDLFSESQIQSILSQNSSGLDEETAKRSLRSWAINVSSGQIALLDFNNPGLCGTAGCLYTGYLMQRDQPPVEVFRARFHSELPRSKRLFEIGETQATGMPCLLVWQSELHQQFRRLQFCYDGRSYQLTSQSLYK